MMGLDHETVELPEVDEETRTGFKYTCIVCGEPNNFWWMYCQRHAAQCEREMDEATS